MVKAERAKRREDWVSVEGPFTTADLEELGTFGAIEKLSLTEQPLVTGVIAKGLRSVLSVDQLWLWCTVTRAAMRYLVSIPGIRILDVLDIRNPGRLSGFSSAQALHEFRCSLCLTEEDLLEIATCRSLQQIGVQSSQLTQKALKRLLKLPNLRSLDIEGTRFDDRMAALISESETLQALDVGATRLTRKGLEHIVQLPQIRSLDLWATRLEETDFDLLAQLPQLEYLSVGGNSFAPQKFNPDSLFERLCQVASLSRLWLDGVILNDEQKLRFEQRFTQFRLTV